VNRRSPGPDLAAIARAASREAGGVPVGMLGDYLPAAADAAASGRRLTATELAGYGRSGEQAALSGVALRGLVDLFLSATWRLWRELPAGTSLAAARAAGLAVLRAGGNSSKTCSPGAAGWVTCSCGAISSGFAWPVRTRSWWPAQPRPERR
jgi:hypothetical protein